MFAKEDYTALAELWTEFVRIHGEVLAQAARQRYQCGISEFSDQDDLSDECEFEEFGSPADLVEQLFIESFNAYKLTLLSRHYVPTYVIAKDPNKDFRLLDRLTTFESSDVAASTQGPGQVRFWINQVGSHRFKVWPVVLGAADVWAAKYVSGDLAKTLVSDLPYHTLPYTYERHRFTIPHPLPPWTEDTLDEVYVEQLQELGSKHHVCLDDNRTKLWRSEILRPSWVGKIDGVENAPSHSGRPRKVDQVHDAYCSLDTSDQTRNMKEVCRIIEGLIGKSVSVSTLRRAKALSKEPRSKAMRS